MDGSVGVSETVVCDMVLEYLSFLAGRGRNSSAMICLEEGEGG